MDTFFRAIRQLFHDNEEHDAMEEEEVEDHELPVQKCKRKSQKRVTSKEACDWVEQYFLENWFIDEWISWFTDIGLPLGQTRDGTWNVNNWMERASLCSILSF
ncbi:hypothetical protein JB92DRAFT_3121804 [Gautieria morchelliformis]|nr:hypothetical protein JB92DRAFT_3121804 [Gautieria morchelliformis]